MLRLLQVINYMYVDLKQTENDIIETFEALESGRLNQTGLCMELGLELPSDAMFERFERALPKWPSALAIVKSRMGV
jgi:hypothetical protein